MDRSYGGPLGKILGKIKKMYISRNLGNFKRTLLKYIQSYACFARYIIWKFIVNKVQEYLSTVFSV